MGYIIDIIKNLLVAGMQIHQVDKGSFTNDVIGLGGGGFSNYDG